jgi:hypothetical protein
MINERKGRIRMISDDYVFPSLVGAAPFALRAIIEDRELPEHRRVEAIRELMRRGDEHSRVALGVIAAERARDPRSSLLAHMFEAIAAGPLKPTAMALRGLDDGSPGAFVAWERSKLGHANILVPWLPASAAGRALAWLHAKKPEHREYLYSRGREPMDEAFDAYWVGRAKPWTDSPEKDAARQRLAELARGILGSDPPEGWVNIALAIARASGAEDVRGFLTPYAREQLELYEMTMSVPTSDEIAKGLEGASGVLGIPDTR